MLRGGQKISGNFWGSFRWGINVFIMVISLPDMHRVLFE